MPPRVAKKRFSNSSSSSKGPKSKKFRKSTKPSVRVDRSKHKGRSSFGFKRKQNPFLKKKGPRGIYKKSNNVRRTDTESEGTLQEDSKKTTFEGKFFRRHKPLAKKKVLTTKERRQLRRRLKENYPIVEKSKGKWETLRRHDCNTSQRSKIITELVEATQGHVAELVSKHDTVRVVQCMLQYGTADQRDRLFSEIKDSIKDLVKQKYAKHLILKILKYGTPSQRSTVMRAFHGSVCKLVKHTEASTVLETAYNDYATSEQRSALHLEFYGGQYAYFKPPDLHSLSDVLTTSSAAEKTSTLKYIKTHLLALVDRPGFKYSIVHHVLLEYLTHAEEEGRTEMIEAVRERLVEIVHTKDGAKATMCCVWHGTPKDRKAIIKSFKGFVKKICFEEHGFLILLACFDTVDDTVLVRKTLLSEILSELEEISYHPNGCRLLLYLLCPRSPEHFKKSLCALLEPGDDNKHSKKDATVRQSELIEAVSTGLVGLAEDKLEEWIRDKHLCHLLIETIFKCKADVSNLLSHIIVLLKEEFSENNHIIVDPVGHFVIKRMIMIESKQLETGEFGKGRLSEMILDSVEPEELRRWSTTNRGAFVLCSMVLSRQPGVSTRITEVLEPVLPALKAGNLKGQQALVNDLQKTSNEEI